MDPHQHTTHSNTTEANIGINVTTPIQQPRRRHQAVIHWVTCPRTQLAVGVNPGGVAILKSDQGQAAAVQNSQRHQQGHGQQ